MADFGQTVLSLIDEASVGVRGDTGTSADNFDTFLSYFNKSLQKLTLAHNWRWAKKKATVSTVKSATTVNLATDVLRVHEVTTIVSGKNKRLLLISEDEAATRYPNDIDEGSPLAYVSGVYDFTTNTLPPIKTLEIKPTPDAIYVLSYSYQYAFIGYVSGETAQVPPIPQFLYPALTALIRIELLRFFSYPKSEIEEAKQDFATWLSAAKVFDRDHNKGQRSIRLYQALSNHRQNRYNR